MTAPAYASGVPSPLDPRLVQGLLSLSQASRYLRLARQTFHRWARGYERGRPLLHVRDPHDDGLPVTFTSLTEAHVMDGLREAGVQPRKIRPALDELGRQFGHDYVLIAPELATDGVELLWDFSRSDAGSGLIVGDRSTRLSRDRWRLSQLHPPGFAGRAGRPGAPALASIEGDRRRAAVVRPADLRSVRCAGGRRSGDAESG